MADIATRQATGGSLSARTALQLAWTTWMVMLVIPFFLFLAIVWTLGMRADATMPSNDERWFLGASIYLLVVVPASFFCAGTYSKRIGRVRRSGRRPISMEC